MKYTAIPGRTCSTVQKFKIRDAKPTVLSCIQTKYLSRARLCMTFQPNVCMNVPDNEYTGNCLKCQTNISFLPGIQYYTKQKNFLFSRCHISLEFGLKYNADIYSDISNKVILFLSMIKSSLVSTCILHIFKEGRSALPISDFLSHQQPSTYQTAKRKEKAAYPKLVNTSTFGLLPAAHRTLLVSELLLILILNTLLAEHGT